MDKKRRKLNNILSILVFFAAGYLSLNVLADSLHYFILGILFLIAGVYGIVCIYKKVRFVF